MCTVLLAWLFLPIPKMLFSDDGSILIIVSLLMVPVAVSQLLLLLSGSYRKSLFSAISQQTRNISLICVAIYSIIGIYAIVELYVLGL